MRLHNIIADKPGARKTRKRVGRGRGSGHGKTSTTGHNGQKSRSGGGIPIGFEGGQIPLYRILPTRGFSNHRFKTEYAIVNVSDLEKIESDKVIDRNALESAGLIRKNKLPVKLLGNGNIGKAVQVKVDKVSDAAKAKIEGAGGKVIISKPKTESAKSEK